MKKTNILVCLGMAILLSSCGFCKLGFGKRYFSKMDSNSDAMVSKSEFMNHKLKRFKKKDKNDDGFITKDEIINYQQEKYKKVQKEGYHSVKSILKRKDKDGDGKISRSEYSDVNKAKFAKIDADGNDKLSSDEFDSYFHKMKKKH